MIDRVLHSPTATPPRRPQRRQLGRRPAVVGLLVTVALLAAGCGGSDGSARAASPAPTPPAEPAGAPPEPPAPEPPPPEPTPAPTESSPAPAPTPEPPPAQPATTTTTEPPPPAEPEPPPPAQPATTSTTEPPPPPTTTTTTTEAPPPEPSYYDAPGDLAVPLPLAPGSPGEIIGLEELDLGDNYVGYRILYHSRSLQGEDIAVSGFAVTPAGEPPEGGWPLVAFAHGTAGTADICAPSHEAESQIATWAPYLAGYAVAATDYEGLGTPGLHPYVVGRSEARGVLDSVRAVQHLPDLAVSEDFVVWGHSQGGHAAIHTGQHWQDYAPELALLGVVAGAPPSQFSLLYNVLLGGPFQGYLAMASGAFAAAYPELELSQIFTDEAVALMDVLETGCTRAVFEAFNPLSQEDMLIVPSPLGVDGWAQVIVENDVNQAPVPVPLLILHGAADEQIPAISSRLLLGQLCLLSDHGPTQRIEYPGETHGSVIGIQRDDLLGWIAGRFAGEPAPDTCAR